MIKAKTPAKKNISKAKTRTPSDNLCKLLAEKYPEQFIEWLFGIKVENVEILKTELSREPVRLDSANLLESNNQLFHIEFQTTAKSHLPLPLRMLDYYVALRRKFLDKEINQALVVLHDNGEEVSDRYQGKGWFFPFHVVKFWEVDFEDISEHKELLPLGGLCRVKTTKENLLREVAERINEVEDKEERSEMIDMARVFAGLRLNPKIVYELLRGENMLEESSVVQGWLRRGRKEGLEKGLEKGKEEGERLAVVKLLTKRFGKLSISTKNKIENLSLKQIDNLIDSLLDFKEKTDLTKWLREQSR